MVEIKHVYLCKTCKSRLDLHLDHAGTWTQETGCGTDCKGTFRHPAGGHCHLHGRDVGHTSARLILVEG